MKNLPPSLFLSQWRAQTIGPASQSTNQDHLMYMCVCVCIYIDIYVYRCALGTNYKLQRVIPKILFYRLDKIIKIMQYFNKNELRMIFKIHMLTCICLLSSHLAGWKVKRISSLKWDNTYENNFQRNGNVHLGFSFSLWDCLLTTKHETFYLDWSSQDSSVRGESWGAGPSRDSMTLCT